MNQPGGWPRPETGWRLTTVRFEFSVLCDPRPVLASWAEDPLFLESEPARAAGTASKADERASVTVRVRRSPRNGW
jgi:hypothetical protein